MNFRVTPPPLSSGQVIEHADKLIKEYCSIVGRSALVHYGLRFEDVYEQVIYPKYEIELDETQELDVDDNGTKILGCFEPIQNKGQLYT
jgi:hypothetical protein